MRHTLILLRHAKSDWSSGAADHERPLNARGERDAPLTGQWLVATKRVPDHVLCSTARRTRETYALAAEAFDAGAGPDAAPEVRYLDEIYGAPAGQMLEAIRAVPENVRTLLVVGHNPGTQHLALALADESNPELVTRVYNGYPTNTATVLETDSKWSELDPGGASIVEVMSARG
jgi:phosphohistidine phosphatase